MSAPDPFFGLPVVFDVTVPQGVVIIDGETPKGIALEGYDGPDEIQGGRWDGLSVGANEGWSR